MPEGTPRAWWYGLVLIMAGFVVVTLIDGAFRLATPKPHAADYVAAKALVAEMGYTKTAAPWTLYDKRKHHRYVIVVHGLVMVRRGDEAIAHAIVCFAPVPVTAQTFWCEDYLGETLTPTND